MSSSGPRLPWLYPPSTHLPPLAADYTVSDTVAVPYELNSDDSLTVTSAGSITVVGEGHRIFSVGVHNVFNGTITNSGIIGVTATNGTGSTAYAFGVGVDVEYNLLGSITNQGTITINVLSTENDAYGVGIDIGDGADGMGAGSSLTNDGIISVTAARGGYAVAAGIVANDLLEGASVTNAGTITVTATGSSMAEGFGIKADDLTLMA